MEHKGLLSGMKVLDLSRVLAAPYCGMMLADLGAEVIKIERPGKGDDARSNFPIVNGESAYYMNLNRNKRGIVLNLKSQAGKEVFRKLVAQSDVVLENYRPGVMDRLGLGYEELRKINRIIEREYPDAHRETLVVLDGTTGQNALAQAKQFGEVADITGIILTKLDGTAKGGIAIAIQSELHVPVKYIGIGEQIDDLQKFDADQFVDALFE